ncbi:hypothetical protein Droror1_Dr00010392 [Drosera rotundifolia]
MDVVHEMQVKNRLNIAGNPKRRKRPLFSVLHRSLLPSHAATADSTAIPSPSSLLTRQPRTPRRRWTPTVTTVSGAAANWEVVLGSAVATVSSGESNKGGAALGGFDGVQRWQQEGKRAAGSASSISRVSIL